MLNVVIVALLAVLAAWAGWRTVRRARHGSACCGEREAAPERLAVADRDRSHYPFEITLRIGGMTCENCARRVENALNALGDTWATVSIASHTAKVRCKREPDLRRLSDAVREAGYVVMK